MFGRFLPLFVLLFAAYSQTDPSIESADGQSTDPSPDVSFEGGFDSMGAGNIVGHAMAEEGEQQEQDLLDFSEYMQDFLPDETFTFRLQPYSEEIFMLWPGAEVASIRGMFHSQIEEQGEDNYVSLILYDNERVVRNYRQQRLGVFSFPHNLRDHRYTFVFSSGSTPVDAYLSYQFVSQVKKNTSAAVDLPAVVARFQKVSQLVVAQESEMRRLLGMGERHRERVERYLQGMKLGAMAESIVVIASSLVSLHILKNQIRAGYELLV